MTTRLLVLEDDDGIRSALALALEDEGYEVLQHADAEHALSTVADERVDLMLVDLMLGGMDGFTFIRRARPLSQAPIIVLSARNETNDIVGALEVGADDYVTKPFVVQEVSARLRALLRRPATADPDAAAAAGTAAVTATSRQPVTVLDAAQELVLDLDGGAVRRSDVEVHLTVTEFRLLCELASPPGRVLSRRTLLERVWNRGFFGDERIVDVHIRRLRTKVEQDAGNPTLVVTVRGLGYRLDVR
ncbi:winged helix-turn-helix domain-containing protein [Angustibacter sp. McL0619]|uniref:winged helix-turn-helix domain-containing protein n=1 Tax=Angustibacter sp. McL0619 TaxID=3415676 RepID=UPI003CEB6F34